jgi:hypothetical protein
MSARSKTTHPALIGSIVVAAALVAMLGIIPVVAGPSSGSPLAAPVADAAARTMGDGPVNDMLAWADAKKACGLTRDQLAAMMITPTFFEAGAPTNRSPSPMTMSRYDTSSGLYAFGAPGAANKAFFHPGAGLWQFDSAGGWPLTASGAINTYTASSQAATVIANRWCNSSGSDVARRAYAWGPWFECTNGSTAAGSCEAVYNSVLVNGVLTVDRDPATGSLGGMEQRTCSVGGIGSVSCAYVDPSRAQGWTSFTAPGFGPSPITAPFYVFDSGGREYRYWLSADTGYSATIEADKLITADARTGTTWRNNQENLCDQTARRGSCAGSGLVPWSTVFSFGGSTLGDVAVGTNADGRQELFVVGTDGQVWHSWQNTPNGFWSGWFALGGSFPAASTPAVGRNQDGRLELFALGSDGGIWHNFQQSPNSDWSGFTSLGGSSAASPAVVSNADGHLELFALNTNGQLWHDYQSAPNQPFVGWFPFGGGWSPGTKVTPVTNFDGRLEVFATANDGQIWHSWQGSVNGSFSGFLPLGGSFPLGRQVGVARNFDGRLEVFATASDGQLWHAWQVAAGSAWSSFNVLGGSWSTAPAVLRDQSGRLDLVAIGTNGQLGVQVQTTAGSSWQPVAYLGGSGGRRPELGVNADGHVEAFYVGADNVIDHAWQMSPP